MPYQDDSNNHNEYVSRSSGTRRISASGKTNRGQGTSSKGRHSAHSSRAGIYSTPDQRPDNVIRVKKKKKNHKGRKIALTVLIVVVVLFGGTAAAAAWYYNDLTSNIAYTGDVESLTAVLQEPEKQEPFYVLVIGSDKWENNGARSDAMVLTRVDLNTGTITMVSVPRDTPYQIKGKTCKLNAVFEEQGEAACIEAVSEVTGVPISHYVELEFDQLAEVVDSLGGVLVDVPYSFNYTVYTKDQPTVYVKAGEQILDSERAVALVRNRTSYESDQDAIRQANIRAMMVATMKSVLAAPVTEIPGNIQLLSKMISTDIPMNDLVDWALQLREAPKTKVYSCTGPYQGGIDAETGLWLTTYAPESWEALMKAVDAGENPENVLSTDEEGNLKLETTDVIENK